MALRCLDNHVHVQDFKALRNSKISSLPVCLVQNILIPSLDSYKRDTFNSTSFNSHNRTWLLLEKGTSV